MATITSFHNFLPAHLSHRLRERMRHVAWPSWALAFLAIAFIGGNEFVLAMQSPGQTLRGELAAAAATVRASPASGSADELRRAVQRHFRDQAVRVDPTGFPAHVAVTLYGLDRDTCLDAEATARRIEGLVVVDLQGYRSAADCRDENDMTWRIMP